MKVQPVITAELIHIHGPMKGNIQEFAEDCISIGRHPSCSILFPSELTAISRKHAEILRDGNRYKVVDHSTNGTFLNGRKVSEAFLKDGDVLEFAEGGPKLSFLSKVSEQTVAPVTSRQTPAGPADIEEKIPLPESEPELPDSPMPPAAGSQPVDVPSTPVRTNAETPPPLTVEKVAVPVVIQFGPSIKTFREVPILVGSGPGCDFIIQQSALQQQHLQILFSRGEYWIRDVTGQGAVCINGKPINLQSPVHSNDLIRLSPSGPLLSFLGEGRFAEAAEVPESATGPSAGENDEILSPQNGHGEHSEGLWARLRRRF